MNTSLVISLHKEAIRRAAAQHRATNPRVFGSAARGVDTAQSDIDLLVDAEPGTTLFDLGALQVELEGLLGMPVDVVTPGDLPAAFRDQALAEARPI